MEIMSVKHGKKTESMTKFQNKFRGLKILLKIQAREVTNVKKECQNQKTDMTATGDLIIERNLKTTKEHDSTAVGKCKENQSQTNCN